MKEYYMFSEKTYEPGDIIARAYGNGPAIVVYPLSRVAEGQLDLTLYRVGAERTQGWVGQPYHGVMDTDQAVVLEKMSGWDDAARARFMGACVAHVEKFLSPQFNSRAEAIAAHRSGEAKRFACTPVYGAAGAARYAQDGEINMVANYARYARDYSFSSAGWSGGDDYEGNWQSLFIVALAEGDDKMVKAVLGSESSYDFEEIETVYKRTNHALLS
jgi:hypothetical protein